MDEGVEKENKGKGHTREGTAAQATRVKSMTVPSEWGCTKKNQRLKWPPDWSRVAEVYSQRYTQVEPRWEREKKTRPKNPKQANGFPAYRVTPPPLAKST